MNGRKIVYWACVLAAVCAARPARAISIRESVGKVLSGMVQWAEQADTQSLGPYLWMYADEEMGDAAEVDKQAELLISLGVTGLTEEGIEDVKAGLDAVREYGGWTRSQTMLMLLYSAGAGRYDSEWNWSPSSNTVYSFDAEVLDVSCMYSTFLTGIASIGQGELTFTEVREDMSDVEEEAGTGVRHVFFCLNGTPYTYDAQEMQDWFDMGMLNFMNEVLEAEDTNGRLYVTTDGLQGCIVFYATADWAKCFMEKTGCMLFTGFY